MVSLKPIKNKKYLKHFEYEMHIAHTSFPHIEKPVLDLM